MIGTAAGVLVGLLALSIPVAATMGILALIMSGLYSKLPLSLAAGEVVWATSTSFILVSIPLFVLLGEILLRSGMAERMYAAMIQWLSWLPGGLMHANIGACTMFAATSGSSVATAATIGTVALAEVKKYGYSERLFLGSLAAGGTLGILIPPSINMIVYGVLTSTSIPQLYLAGFIPGFLLASLFSVTVLLGCLVRPQWGGRPVVTDWPSRIRSLPDLVPPLLIFFLVVGSIYAGLATPTEAAALGVLGALAVAAWNRRLTWKVLVLALEGTMRTSAMAMAILVAAYFLNFVITSIGLTGQVNRTITTLGLTPFETLLIVIVFYVGLGMFMETLSMMVATVPIIVPVMVSLGYDPVWFGIIIILLIETAMITPPVGINLFVVQGLRRGGPLNDVLIGAAPFVITLLIMIAIMVAVPDLALWLPTTVGNYVPLGR
ncbi:MAG: TRAP transporter large permease [Pseudomonadota bacterium]